MNYRNKRDDDSIEMSLTNSLKTVKDVTILERIGGGNFGVVWRGVMAGTIPVALKQRKGEENSKDSSENSIVREATILVMLNNKSIVMCYGIYKDKEKNVFMVTEFVDKGSMSQLLQKEANRLEQQDLLQLYVLQIIGNALLIICLDVMMWQWD